MDIQEFCNKRAHFASKFCNELDQNKSQVCSPLSAEYVLAILALGAENPSNSELLKTLGFADNESIFRSFSQLSKRLKSIKGITLNVANKVYIKDGFYELNNELKSVIFEMLETGIEKIDFNNGVAAAQIINNWVEEQTCNKIQDLLSAESINGDCRLILVNALYFKGTWKKKFSTYGTKDKTFNISRTDETKVPMMSMTDEFLYLDSNELNSKMVELPYEGDEASFLIILPNDIEGLVDVQNKLANNFNLASEMSKMTPNQVYLQVPKFKIKTEIDLMTILPKLGVKSIFDRSNSGLSNLLTIRENLYVSKAVQKAFIEVNEEGSEAAAATAMGIAMCCAIVDPRPVMEFLADRPFLAVILVHKTPYFLASYYGK